jgi:hypothetical protein
LETFATEGLSSKQVVLSQAEISRSEENFINKGYSSQCLR